MADTIKVTLVKSPIGAVRKHKKTVKAMGRTKMHKKMCIRDRCKTGFHPCTTVDWRRCSIRSGTERL